MCPQKSIYCLDFVPFSIPSMFFHFFPFPTVRSLLQRESPDSSLPHSLSMLFCSFFKKSWSFKAAVPKFSSFLHKQNWFLPLEAPRGCCSNIPSPGQAPPASLPQYQQAAKQQLLFEKQQQRLENLLAASLPGRYLEGTNTCISVIWNGLWNATTSLDEQIAGNCQEGNRKTEHKTSQPRKKNHSLQLMKLIYMYFLYNYG